MEVMGLMLGEFVDDYTVKVMHGLLPPLLTWSPPYSRANHNSSGNGATRHAANAIAVLFSCVITSAQTVLP